MRECEIDKQIEPAAVTVHICDGEGLAGEKISKFTIAKLGGLGTLQECLLISSF